ncbi:MAG: DNA cytosine methyltransferase, partial [Desulfuromonadales bacterium]|nr:DNA cytosine methyltransferase [Desulfuromonadales bacterium]
MPSFYEFFAGGGMAKAGLGEQWNCLFANDIDRKKADSYARNWGDEHLAVQDVAKLTTQDLPGSTDLVWASFPCQDLSLAGVGAGLQAKRSGAFWPFWGLVCDLTAAGRGPKIVVLENVVGALHSHKGKDFAAIAQAFSDIGYRFGALVINAVDFVPQSRPRLFIIGVRPDIELPNNLIQPSPHDKWHPKAVLKAHAQLSKASAKKWLWWRLPKPEVRQDSLNDLIEEQPTGVRWHT